MRAYYILLPFLALCFVSCSSEKVGVDAPEPVCMQTGFTSERVCTVSHFQALGSDLYVGRVIRISGYLANIRVGGEEKRLLFFSQEQAAMPNVGSGIDVGDFSSGVKPNRMDAYKKILENSDGKSIEIVGTLRRNDAIGLAEPTHIIENVVGVREVFNEIKVRSGSPVVP